ncbi:VanZ family protein [Flavobacterium sp. SM2513]|uniref:VanZ family protein n=1 Tax=Flavobacterium sp. SM2513 TaxID=3424766 RepID=UPI003D7FB689
MNYFQVKLIKNLSEYKKTIQALTVFWTGMVAYLCLVSSDRLPEVDVIDFDKLGHFTFHFGLTFLWFLFWKATYRTENKFALLKAFLFSFFFGVVIEVCQGVFTETRYSDIRDVYANSVGALVAVLVLFLANKYRSKT